MDDVKREVAREAEAASCDINDEETCKSEAEPAITLVSQDEPESGEPGDKPSGDKSLYLDKHLGIKSQTQLPPKNLHETGPHVSHLRNIDGPIYASFATIISVCIWAGWYYRRFKEQQREWRELSNKELAKIRERSNAVSNASVESPKHLIEQLSERDKYAPGFDIHSTEDVLEQNEDVLDHNCLDASTSDNENPSHPEMASVETSSPTNNLANIRARQQKLHKARIESAKLQRRRQRMLRQQRLVDSLHHNVANEAHRRRKHVISEEQQSVVQATNYNEEASEQTIFEEFQEMERQALLQQQNREYNESLQRDQERARIKALKIEKLRKRKKAVIDAKYRLVKSGLKLPSLLDDFRRRMAMSCGEQIGSDCNQEGSNNDSLNVQVKLLLPSGKKYQEVFIETHTIGLLYDFALVVLDNENLLWYDDVQDSNDLIHEVDYANEFDFSSENVDYSDIRPEWEEIFARFSLISPYPRVTHNDLNRTLNQSGFIQSVTLLVAIEA